MSQAAPAGEIRLKRVYEPPEPEDGTRVLVERLWPRGVSKEGAALMKAYLEERIEGRSPDPGRCRRGSSPYSFCVSGRTLMIPIRIRSRGRNGAFRTGAGRDEAS